MYIKFSLLKKGGYFICVDHQTPPELSLEDYKLYIKLFKEFLNYSNPGLNCKKNYQEFIRRISNRGKR